MPDRSLAFIDPGMRLTPYLCAACERLPSSVRPIFFVRRPKPRSLLRRAGHRTVGVGPNHGAGYRRDGGHAPDIDAEALIKTLRLPRDRHAVSARTREYRGVEASVRRFLEDHGADGVFLWNGSGLAAGIAAQIARRNGIPVAFGENGYLPGTMQLDPRGVNAAASFGPASTSLEQILACRWTASQDATLEDLLERYRAGQGYSPGATRPRRLKASPVAYLHQALLDISRDGRTRRMNRLIPQRTPPLPERFLFFPLQVRQDSQLTVHSPLYGPRLDEAISDLAAALTEVAPEVRLVIKLHPADRRKTDYDPLIRRLPNIVWIGAGDVRDVLREAQAVVTINSTVGVEALIFGKPVVVLGDAVYGFERLVHLVRTRDRLAATLARALSTPADGELTRRYLSYLYFKALTRAHPSDYSESSVREFNARLIEALWMNDGDRA
jgi:capsular polysaccharide export protein